VALEQAGIYALVLEGVPLELARQITARLQIPTIGIGAGKHCDGQVLVCYDLLGMNPTWKPKFVKQYASLHENITGAAQSFFTEVREQRFPDEEHSFRSTTMRLVASNPDVAPSELLRQVDAAMAKRAPCRIYSPDLCAAAGLADRAAFERRRFDMLQQTEG
jgi:hypothetical protein